MYRLGIVFCMVAGLALSAAAAPSAQAAKPERYFERTTSLFFDAYVPDGFVSFFEYYESYDICLSIGNTYSCTDAVDGDMLIVKQNFASLRLGPAPIRVEECNAIGEECVETERLLTITFEAIGDPNRHLDQTKWSNGCKYMNVSKWLYREGTATITLGDESYTSDDVLLIRGNDLFQVRCKR